MTTKNQRFALVIATMYLLVLILLSVWGVSEGEYRELFIGLSFFFGAHVIIAVVACLMALVVSWIEQGR